MERLHEKINDLIEDIKRNFFEKNIGNKPDWIWIMMNLRSVDEVIKRMEENEESETEVE